MLFFFFKLHFNIVLSLWMLQRDGSYVGNGMMNLTLEKNLLLLSGLFLLSGPLFISR